MKGVNTMYGLKLYLFKKLYSFISRLRLEQETMWFNIKYVHIENTPSNKTRALTKCMNMDIWAIGILNQLFIKDFCTQIKFSKKLSQSVINSILCDRSILYSHSICIINIGFSQDSFVWKCCAFNRRTLNLSTVLQFFKKGFGFSENLLQI